MDAETRAVILRRLDRAENEVCFIEPASYMGHYAEDVRELLKELKLAEETRDAAQAGGTSVHLFRQRIVTMLRAIGYRGIADDIEKERVPDEKDSPDVRKLLADLVAENAEKCSAVAGSVGQGRLADNEEPICGKPARWGVLTAWTCDEHRRERDENEIGGPALRAAFAFLAPRTR